MVDIDLERFFDRVKHDMLMARVVKDKRVLKLIRAYLSGYVSYLNVCGTFYYLCSLLEGCSRYIVRWEIREHLTEPDVETVPQRGREISQEARPRIVSGNGPQFVARDFKEFVRACGMTHVRTSPYYLQGNGKIEIWHKTIKRECVLP